MNTRLLGLQFGLIKSALKAGSPNIPSTSYNFEPQPAAFTPPAPKPAPPKRELTFEDFLNRPGPANEVTPGDMRQLSSRFSGKSENTADQLDAIPPQASSTPDAPTPSPAVDNQAALANAWKKYTGTSYNALRGGTDARAMQTALKSLRGRDWNTLSEREKYNIMNSATQAALRRR